MNKPLFLALLTVWTALVVFRVNGTNSPAQLDLEKAKGLEARGDFEAAICALNAGLSALPDNDEAKLLRAEWQEQLRAAGEEAQRQQVLAKRERHPREYFEHWTSTALNNQLFVEQEMKVKGTSSDVEAAPLGAYERTPHFQIADAAIS